MTEGAEVRNLSGMAKVLPGWQPACFLLVVIYGQEVLYAVGGQDARSRPAKARLHGCTPTGM